MLNLAPAVLRTIGSGVLIVAAVASLRVATPWSLIWTAPLLLLAALLIAWAAESAQFFIAQGFALAILAWLQTLPEFAVEAVLAWHQQRPLLLSNLTGALRLLTGVGWPLIYVTAAVAHRLRGQGKLGAVRLEKQDSVQVLTLVGVLVWVFAIVLKGSLGLVDSVILIALYGGFLVMLNRVPPEPRESVEELERVPRAIVKARPALRNVAIPLLFAAGGGLIFVVAEPFLASLLAVAAAAGITQFVAVQWIAPFVSEFPEKVSAFYWARTIDRAPMALMNMVSSNINQWTLLAAMLPIVLSLGAGAASTIYFDHQQSIELLMTAAQSLLGALLLFDMELAWWEAAALFVLWMTQFVLSILPVPLVWRVHEGVTAIYLGWCAFEIVRMAMRGRAPAVIRAFRDLR
jgi:cation:H+ antiporter